MLFHYFGSQKCQEYIGTFCWFEFTLIPTLVVPLVTLLLPIITTFNDPLKLTI